MKYFYTIVALFLPIATIFSQTLTRTFSTGDKSYTAKVELQKDNSLKVLISDGADTPVEKSFSIWTESFEQFTKTFSENFCSEFSSVGACLGTTTTDKQKLEAFATKLFFDYQTTLATDDTEPVAGIFRVRDSARLYMRSRSKGNKRVFNSDEIGKIKIVNVTAEVNESYMENIKVHCKLPNGSTMAFTLPYAMGISSVNNFKSYFHRNLFSLDSHEFLRKEKKRLDSSKKKGDIIDSAFYISLGDVIDYDYKFGVDRRDFSPQNTVIELLAGESKVLHKGKTSKLFEAHIFTDFVGLQNDKPNGLVQTEVRKRINTNSKQYLIELRAVSWLFKSVGLFQYITPSIVLSKLEEHNKRFPLGDLDSIRANPGSNDTSKYNKFLNRYASALDLFRYKQFSAGATINLVYFSNHDSKYNFHVNFGANLGITQLTDSLTDLTSGKPVKTGFTKDYSINTLQFFPEVKLVFLPEERFNFSIANRFVFIKPVTSELELVSFDKNNPNILRPVKNAWVNSFEMLMSIVVNQDQGGKMFGRLTFNSDMNNIKHNFAQIQLGYSTYILGKKK